MTVTLNPLYRFDTMVVGAANRLAVTASKAVAESPGTVYNPLFIYARPGLGKTHLLMGIGHAARAINPRLSVEYLTLDEFVEAFHAAIAAGHGEAYRKRFLDVDLLLVDDVQFLTHRREMQAELLRLTDALQQANRQIVLTSDRPPAEIEALDERLIRRFAGGLVIDISAPDYETRVAILRRKAEERRAGFADGVLEAVASLGIDNVRELLGALNRLIAFQAVSDTPLGPAEARSLIGGPGAPDADDAPGASVPADAAAESRDEFGEFLSEISATVAQQVDAWRTKVSAALLRWQGEGFVITRLQALLDQEMVSDPARAIGEFEADVERLQAMRREAAELAPELAGSPAFHDPADLAAAEAALARARAGAVPPPAPSPLWRLGELAESTGNRLALESARLVAAEPGTGYNPLVIVGAGGTGKTHLLHAIGNELAGRGGPVACLSAPELTGELIEAIDRDAVAGWRARYRRISAFLLDDVHLIADKDRSQDELFVLFNLLLESGRQMVFTSAVPLAGLPGVEARLRTRLEGGLVVELPPPDEDIRGRVIARALGEKLGRADAALVSYLAARPVESVRAVQGLVQRVIEAAEARGMAPTAGLAREVLEGPVAPVPSRSEAERPRPPRSSGIVAPTAGGARSREKMVWEWPDVSERVLEEWR
ncbi:MAG TPA: DnaA/Hda family protein [Gemmatimonadales bacterium]|nr:DnaA/Hda family protein [Gemmatimonadales bacterium]